MYIVNVLFWSLSFRSFFFLYVTPFFFTCITITTTQEAKRLQQHIYRLASFFFIIDSKEKKRNAGVSQWPANGARQPSFVRSFYTTVQLTTKPESKKSLQSSKLSTYKRQLTKFDDAHSRNHNMYSEQEWRQHEWREKKMLHIESYFMHVYIYIHEHIRHYRIADT